MGVVRETEQLSLSRTVALKLLWPHFTLSPGALDRLEREARAGGRYSVTVIVRL